MFSNRPRQSPSPPGKAAKARSPPDYTPAYITGSPTSPSKKPLVKTRSSPSPPREAPEVRAVDGKFIPEPTVGETERLLPSITVMKHSTKLVRKGKHDPDFLKRSHDPRITDHDAPQEATQLLMVDLRISQKNNKNHRILIMSSPLICCLQTAVIVAQELGVREIQVHHALGEAVNKILDMGWDFAYETLAPRRSEMDRAVRLMSQEGEENRNKAPVVISNMLGKAMGVDDVQESDINYRHRVGEVLDEAASSLEFDGDHVIIIGHDSTVMTFSQHFSETCDVVSIAECGFLTMCTPSSHSCWFSGRSRVQLKPLRSLDPSMKIGSQ